MMFLVFSSVGIFILSSVTCFHGNCRSVVQLEPRVHKLSMKLDNRFKIYLGNEEKNGITDSYEHTQMFIKPS